MCDFSKGFKLCTCQDKAMPIIHHKKSKRRKRHIPILPEFAWTLSRYLGYTSDEFTMEGIAAIPSQVLNQQLTADFVLEQLNQSNCFDFDYQPSKGDCLIIRHSGSGFLSFIFQKGKWTIDHYHIFTDRTEKIKGGKVTEI